jgi:hypothetical protein
MGKIIKWTFSTKLGKFIFLIVCSGMIFGILSLISSWFCFVPMMIGGFVVAIILSITDSKLKWF